MSVFNRRDRRRRQVLRYADTRGRGLEIAPWHSPLVPKSAGFDVAVLDVFDHATLVRKAEQDPHVSSEQVARIETVDIVGNAQDIAELVGERGELGRYDYIVSSHNLEHLPDPIRFLQGCQRVLKPGGVLAMAIPDRRACFDYFRPHTVLTDWLQAHFEGRVRPTAAQVFDQEAFHARYRRWDGVDAESFDIGWNPARIVPLRDLRSAYDVWVRFNAAPDQDYRDTHCWTFMPASFELLIVESSFLGIVDWQIVEVSATRGNEFVATLRNEAAAAHDAAAFHARRAELLHQVMSEAFENVPRRSPRAAAQRVLRRSRAWLTALRYALNRLRQGAPRRV